MEGVGGELTLMVRFPDQPPVFLAGLGENETRKKAKRMLERAPNPKEKCAARLEEIRALE